MVCLATLIVVGSLATGSGRGVTPPRAPINVVFEWNRSLETNVRAAAPPVPSYYAAMHVAMFEAVNTIEREYTRFHVHLQPAFSHLNLSREG
jgi:hypothetical protein